MFPVRQDFFFKGLCYSVISYAPLFIDKDALVIGEGDLALRSVAELADIANLVMAVGVSAEDLETGLGKKLAAMKNVKFYPGHTVKRILGEGYANAVEVVSPDGEELTLKMDGVFVEKELYPQHRVPRRACPPGWGRTHHRGLPESL